MAATDCVSCCRASLPCVLPIGDAHGGSYRPASEAVTDTELLMWCGCLGACACAQGCGTVNGQRDVIASACAREMPYDALAGVPSAETDVNESSATPACSMLTVLPSGAR